MRLAEGADGGTPAAPEVIASETLPAAESDDDADSGTPQGGVEGAEAAGVDEARLTADDVEVAGAEETRRPPEGTDVGTPVAPEGTASKTPSAAEGDGNANSGTLHGGVKGAEAAGASEARPIANNVEVAGVHGTAEGGVEDPGAGGAAAGDASDLRCSRRRMARAAAHSAVRIEAASGSSGEP